MTGQYMRPMCVAAIFGLAIAPIALAKSAAIQESNKTCEIDFKYPVTGHAAIDRDIADWVAGSAREFRDGCKEAAKEGNLGPGGKFSAELNYDVRRNDAAVYSVLFEHYSYTGGAHPNTQQYGRTYFKSDGRRVYIAELIGPSGLRQLSDYAIKDLKRQWGAEAMSDDDWIARGAGPAAPNFEAFAWTANGGLSIQFSPYQVAAYAAGPQTVDVPARVVRGWLRRDPRKPQPSFDCKRAGTRLEKGICADWRLARADRQMAEDYRERLDSEFEPAGKQKLIAAQRAWVAKRDESCGRADDLAACLTPLIDKRRRELTATRE